MRSDLILLATLASSALAYPAEVAVERRTFGLLASLIGDAASDVIGLVDSLLGVGVHGEASLLAGLSAHGAAALEGGALGCSAGVIHADARAELKAWLAGQTHIKGSLKHSLHSWCEGSASATLSADVIAALSVYIPTCADIAAKESIYVTIDGIFSSTELSSTLVLSSSLQASLSAFLDIQVGLAAHIQAGLGVCAAGGIIGSLEANVKASLIAWLDADDCPLEAALKASILGWCHGTHASGLIEIGAIADTALTAISVGASIGAYVEEAGALSVHAQASLAAFLNTNIAVDIDADILVALQACAAGKLAASLDVDVRAALAFWLSGSSCSLGVELKAIVLLWLSVAAKVEASLDLVSGLFVDISAFLTETIIESLSINLRGALGLLACGESLATLSWEARAELAAFLGGCTGIEIGFSIQIIIIEWFTGCGIPGAPAPSSSVPSLPSATPSTPLIPSGPAATSSVSVTVPAGGVPTGSVPSGSVPSGPAGSVSVTVPSGPAPTGSVTVPAGGIPGNGASSTPCDTETIPVVTSSVIPGGPAGGAGSVTVPSGPAPTGPAGGSGSGSGSPAGPSVTGAGPASTPCETAPSGASPTGGSGSGSSGSSGSGSSGSGSGSGTWSAGGAPAPTAAPTGSGHGGSGSGSWTETITIYHTVCSCE